MEKRFARHTVAAVLGLALTGLAGAGTAASAGPGTTAWGKAAPPVAVPAKPCPNVLTTAWGDGHPPFGHCPV
ncbi:hypothetical protein ACPC54_35805 [Kitasatospora sp. NPDC094028]